MKTNKSISIHALLAESDPAIDVFLAVWAVISIHALLAESDNGSRRRTYQPNAFLSTLSLRRATVTVLGIQHRTGISIHALLAESDRYWSCVLVVGRSISIHALLAESDTAFDVLAVSALLISIHALLAESDPLIRFCPGTNTDFYPRSPCGERLVILRKRNTPLTISIHALLAESDYDTYAKVLRVNISIHALLAESDTRF